MKTSSRTENSRVDGDLVLRHLLDVGYARHSGGHYRLFDPVYGMFEAFSFHFGPRRRRRVLRWRTCATGTLRFFNFKAGGDIVAAHRRMLEYVSHVLKKSLYVSLMDAALLRAAGFKISGRRRWRKYPHTISFTDAFSRKTYYPPSEDGWKRPAAVFEYVSVRDMLAVDGYILLKKRPCSP